MALALPLAAGANNDPGLVDYAGTGSAGYSGDGGMAVDAELANPHTVAPYRNGYLIADTDNNRVRMVAADGKITTVAGSGTQGFNGDALPATMADLDHPEGVAATADGGFLIADTGNNRIRKVLPGLGLITTVAGTGSAGDGGLLGIAATLTDLNAPTSVAPTPDGGFLVADNGNDKIRKVSSLGLIYTVAGGNGPGYSGDGGQATDAQLQCPHDVAVTPDGGFLIADSTNNVIREVFADGTIDTVAGDGSAGYSGDDGDPLSAQLYDPKGVAVLRGGGFLIADTGNDAIRRVKSGNIKTKADSNGASRTAGGTTAAHVNQLTAPEDVLGVDSAMLVADSGGDRVRLVGELESSTPSAPVDPTPPASTSSDSRDFNPPSAPTVGEDLNVARTEGTIRIKLPGSGEFVRLDQDASIPFGSVVDAATGTVTLTTAHNGSGETQSAAFKGALFKVTQKKAKKPITDLELRGGDFTSCGAAQKSGLAMAARSGKGARRHLWGSGHGRFRTIGRHGAATVRGTIWLTADRCDGTLVRVRRGKVEVRDFRAKKTVFVRAGHSYFARKHPRKAKRHHHRR